MASTSISGTTSTTTTSSSASSQTSSADALGKDSFLKLLMAQMSNQDPTSPMDSQAFASQLAQFANVEQLQTANKSLSSLLLSQSTQNNTAAASLVGKNALINSRQISLTAGQSSNIYAQLGANADNVTTVITDSSGKTVRTLQLGNRSSGNLQVTWDGLDDQGNQLPAGDYRAQINATNKNGTSVQVQQQISARITGVSFQSDGPVLLLGSQQVKLADVVQVLQSN